VHALEVCIGDGGGEFWRCGALGCGRFGGGCCIVTVVSECCFAKARTEHSPDFSPLIDLTCSAQPDGTFAYKANFSDWRLDGGKIPYGIFQVGVPATAWGMCPTLSCRACVGAGSPELNTLYTSGGVEGGGGEAEGGGVLALPCL
jgi:hypothetical protein